MNPEEAPLVVETQGGLSVRYRDRFLYSTRDPARSPRRAALACDPGPGRVHLVFSPLLWYGFPELLGRIGPGSAVLCVEADPALARLAVERAPPGSLDDPRVVFATTFSPEEIAMRAREMGLFRACARTDLSGGASLNAPLYDRMTALLATDIESAWRSRAALVVFGRLWARNVLENLAALPSIAPEPFPSFAGAAVVCGAGPSLETALPFIIANRGRIGVVACDTALGTLLASGVEPDLVVCLEAQAHNLADFVPLEGRPVRLAADLSSHPATFRSVRGPKHVSLVRLAESPFLDRVAALGRELELPIMDLPPLGSVGVHAVRLVRSLAAGPILVAGLDFSFETGKTHSRGSPSLLAGERELDRFSRWPSQYAASFRERTTDAPCSPLPDGRILRSDPVLLSYAALLREIALADGAALYDIRGRGPDIGAIPLSPAGAENLIDSIARRVSHEVRDGPGVGCPGSDAPGVDEVFRVRRSRISAFLEDERGRLGRLRDATKGGSSPDDSAFAALLAESDYLYWSFPDAHRADDLPRDFLNRLAPELEYWSGRLRELARGSPGVT